MKPRSLAKLVSTATLVLALGVTASATAATNTYEGGITGASASTFSFELESKRVKGKQVRTIGAVRASNVPAYCRGDDGTVPVDLRFRANARVARDGSFKSARLRTDDDFDSITYISGRIDGPDASGRIAFTGENPIFDSCSTGVARFFADRARPAR